jgi:hypothetical protein
MECDLLAIFAGGRCRFDNQTEGSISSAAIRTFRKRLDQKPVPAERFERIRIAAKDTVSRSDFDEKAAACGAEEPNDQHVLASIRRKQARKAKHWKLAFELAFADSGDAVIELLNLSARRLNTSFHTARCLARRK